MLDGLAGATGTGALVGKGDRPAACAPRSDEDEFAARQLEQPIGDRWSAVVMFVTRSSIELN